MRHIAFMILLAAPVAPALPAAETRASASAKFAKEFAASDTNHDGALSRTEVEQRIAGMHVKGRKLDMVHAKRLSGLWFDRADANHDGKVTETEAQSLLTATFERYDRNQDGRIEPGERSAAKKAVVR